MIRRVRTDDLYKSHPNEPYSYLDGRLLERLLTEEGIRQFTGPTYKISVTETETTATVTLVLRDLVGDVDPTLRVKFEQDGVSTAPTTDPAAGLTSGTYTYDVDKDPKHTIMIGPVIYLKNGDEIRPVPLAIDFDIDAEVLSVIITTSGTTATVKVQWDTDLVVGTNKAEYSLNSGGSWTAFNTVSGFTGTFTVTMTTSEQVVWIHGKNSAGVFGPIREAVIPPKSGANFVAFTAFGGVPHADDTITVSWAASGTVDHFKLKWHYGGTDYDDPSTALDMGNQTSPFTHVKTIGSGGHGYAIAATPLPPDGHSVEYFITAYDAGGSVLASTGWFSVPFAVGP